MNLHNKSELLFGKRKMIKLNTVEDVNNWVKKAKHAVYKKCLGGIPFALGAFLSYHLAMAIVAIGAVFSVATIATAIATKLNFVASPNFKFSLNKKEINPLLIHPHLKKEVINILLTVTLMNKGSSYWSKKSYIESIESLFIYNQSILEELSFEEVPEEIQEKILRNIESIETVISICGVEIMKQKYTNHAEFKKLLELTSIDKKYEILQANEKVEQDKINTIKLEKSKEEKKKQEIIDYLESKANQQVQKMSCPLVEIEVQKKPKYLSL